MDQVVCSRGTAERHIVLSRRTAGVSPRIAILFSLLGVPAGLWAQTQPAAAPVVTPPPVIVQVPTQSNAATTTNGVNWSQAAQANARNGNANAVQGYGTNPQPTPPPDQPTEFQQLVSRTVGIDLPIFGADLFRNPPSTFAPVETAQVTSDYVIGPGDEIRLSATGQLNQQGSFVVDRAGTISIPEVGTLTVAGLHFSELKPFLMGQLGRVYRNFNLNVTLGQLRSIQVYVTGQARQPGAYTVSSLSTLLNALFASGGVLPQGSMRSIQLFRANKLVTTFDLYDLLLHGDKSKDVSLQPGDVIFIPKAGPQVAAVGSVTNPAIYELRGETTVDQLLAIANGTTSTALTDIARVESIYNHQKRTLEEVNLQKDGNQPLHDGDILTVSAISDQFKDAVTLRGNVTYPGRYHWHPGIRVSDLIPNREALLTRDYFRARNQLGQPLPVPSTPAPAHVPVSSGPAVNTGASNTTAVPVPATPTSGTSANSITGTNTSLAPAAVSTSTNGNGSGTTVGDALTQNNGAFTSTNDIVLSAPDVDLSYAVIERLDRNTLTTSLIPFNLGKLLEGDQSQNIALEPGDVITIFSKADIRVPQSQQTRFVRLEGEFMSSGVYSVKPGETLRQLVARAGGLTPDAYLYASEFTRESTRRLEAQRLHEYADTLEAQINTQVGNEIAGATSATASTTTDAIQQTASAATAAARNVVNRLRAIQPSGRIVLNLKPDSTGLDAIPNIQLEDGDRFVVPRQPTTVTVTGEVYNASAFLYEPDKEVRDYLRQAGGPQRDADSKRMFVVRADGSVVSRQYNNVERATIFPGDTVIMPPQLTHRNFLRDALLISTVVGQLALPVSLIAVLTQ